VKIQKSQLKELIRQSIYELREGGPGSGRKKDDDKYDVGGPSYANVPKGVKSSKDWEKHAMDAADAANKKMDAAEKAAKKKKKLQSG
jgi:hypothetical protein